MTYQEMLRCPEWKEKRTEIYKRDKHACQHCGKKKTEIHVHHLQYHYGFAPWEYQNEEMITLCKRCHEIEHDKIPDVYYVRKYEHLIIYLETPEVVTSIDKQLLQLQNKLLDKIADELMEEVLKNIIFLRQIKKELTTGVYGT